MQEMFNKDPEELKNKHLEELKNKQTRKTKDLGNQGFLVIQSPRMTTKACVQDDSWVGELKSNQSSLEDGEV